MPIPTLNQGAFSTPEEGSSFTLRLVEVPAIENASRSRRVVAHILDLFFLLGASLALAQIVSIVFLQFHLPVVNEFGRQGMRVAQSGYEYGQTWIFWGSFVFFNFLYFVALPFFTQTTFGLGLVGCRLTKQDEDKVSCEALLCRWFGLSIQYVTLGLPSVLNRHGPMLQDRISKTYVTRVDK